METNTLAPKRKRGRPPKNGPLKSATSFRLSEAGRRLVVALSEESGLSQASVVELALRDLAKRRGVPLSGLPAQTGAESAATVDAPQQTA
jgi:hypothetical protein